MAALLSDAHTTHQLIEERLARAVAARPSSDPRRPRDEYPAIDTFLATISRHLAATTTVLVPQARRRLPDGGQRAKEYGTCSRRLSRELGEVKAKLYGSVYAGSLSWTRLWEAVEREYRVLVDVERRLIEDLEEHLDDPEFVLRLHRAELKAPTRPHPYIPQQGFAGSVARALARRVDGFWDTAEGRMMPEPVHQRDRARQGRMTQYLLADPHLEDSPADPWEDENQKG